MTQPTTYLHPAFTEGKAEVEWMLIGPGGEETPVNVTLTIDESKVHVVGTHPDIDMAKPIGQYRQEIEEVFAIGEQFTVYADAIEADDPKGAMPKFPEQVLAFLLSPIALEGMLGDLERNYHRALAQHGERHARDCLVKQVTRSALIALSTAALRFLAIETLLRRL
jgi:hypothetical protein